MGGVTHSTNNPSLTDLALSHDESVTLELLAQAHPDAHFLGLGLAFYYWSAIWFQNMLQVSWYGGENKDMLARTAPKLFDKK